MEEIAGISIIVWVGVAILAIMWAFVPVAVFGIRRELIDIRKMMRKGFLPAVRRIEATVNEGNETPPVVEEPEEPERFSMWS